MAGKINSRKKKRLQKAGLWRKFLEKRNKFKAEGYKPDKARSIAYKEVNKLVGTLGHGNSGMQPYPKRLPNKNTTEIEAIRWCVANLNNPSPNPEDCPSSGAWAMLMGCKSNADFRYDFLVNVWTKLIPSNCTQIEKPKREIDPTVTPELIERIREIRDKAIRYTRSKQNTGGDQ